MTALAVMGLLEENAYVSGSIRLKGRELVGLRDRDLAPLRGDLMSMVFQEPMTALDPTMPVGRQVAEVLLLHQNLDRGNSRAQGHRHPHRGGAGGRGAGRRRVPARASAAASGSASCWRWRSSTGPTS